VAAVLGVKRQRTAVWGCMMSAADRCGWACFLLWGAAATSPGMRAVNDFWEYIYLYQDIVLRRIAVGSWRHFRLQLPYVTGCCTFQAFLMTLMLESSSAPTESVVDSRIRLQFSQWPRFGCGRSLVESYFHTPGPQLLGRSVC